MGSANYKDYLLRGVSKYKIEIEKYKPINEVNKTEDLHYQNALRNFAKKKGKLFNSLSEVPFRFKDIKSQKIKVQLAKYPIDIPQLPSVSKCSFDERLQMILNRCLDLSNLKKKQIELMTDNNLITKSY